MDLAAYMIAFTALAIVTAIHIRIRDLENKGREKENGDKADPVQH